MASFRGKTKESNRGGGGGEQHWGRFLSNSVTFRGIMTQRKGKKGMTALRFPNDSTREVLQGSANGYKKKLKGGYSS